jgi:hypothetical protein
MYGKVHTVALLPIGKKSDSGSWLSVVAVVVVR